HSFLTRPLPLTWFQSTPSEVAELASMSMELISMEHWHVFFDNKEVLRRAKIRQLEKTLGSLPMIAKIDKFQHWLYTNPNHTREERQTQWEKLSAEFSVGLIDISGYEHYFSMDWQRVLHIYEVPFYYIEYAIAQLGAIAMWRQYKQNPEQALSNYIDALKLGYTRPIGEIYETAGISFDFSKKYVKELGEFLMAELEQLY
ncbi:MAG: M3 family metallopeptidase, partial [Chitinophagales bacterium]